METNEENKMKYSQELEEDMNLLKSRHKIDKTLEEKTQNLLLDFYRLEETDEDESVNEKEKLGKEFLQHPFLKNIGQYRCDKEVEEEKKAEEEWKKMPIWKRLIKGIPYLFSSESFALIMVSGMTIFYFLEENKSNFSEKIRDKESYGIQVFYDRGRELLTEMNSLEKKFDSLSAQYSFIKDGIEYIKLNDSEDYKKLKEKVKEYFFINPSTR